LLIYTAKRHPRRSGDQAGSPSECAEVMKRNSRKRNLWAVYPHPRAVNLYEFIRLILGDDISNREIARRWKMDEKNFHEFRVGRYPVPRIEKLVALASVLGVDKHLVFEVACGASARKVFNLIRKNDLTACRALLGVGRPDRGQRTVHIAK